MSSAVASMETNLIRTHKDGGPTIVLPSHFIDYRDDSGRSRIPRLGPVNEDGGSRYCGPVALASMIHGKSRKRSTDLIRKAMRSYEGKEPSAITAVYTSTLLHAVRLAGFTHTGSGTPWVYDDRPVRVVNGKKFPTLARFLRERNEIGRKIAWLIVQRGHFLTVQGNRFYDSMKPEGCFIRSAPNRRAHVVKAYPIFRRRTT